MKKYNFDLEPVARAYLENIDKPIFERIGLVFMESCRFMPIRFLDNCMLPMIDRRRDDECTEWSYCHPIFAYPELYEETAAKHPEIKDELLSMYHEFEKWVPYINMDNVLPETTKYLSKVHAGTGGTWAGHANPGFARYLTLGTDGIRALIEECRAKNPHKDSFYNGCTYAMNAIDIMADRVRDAVRRQMEQETDETKKRRWARIFEVYGTIPRQPAYDMLSASQMFWLLFMLETPDSPGRYDQFMIDYYRKSSEEDRDWCLSDFLEAMHQVRGWNTCLSGSDENWNDQTNELTYAFLEKVKVLGYQTPNLTLRVHKNTPERIWQLAADCIGTGIGIPAIYNDHVVCKALEACGIPDYDAHDYCLNGCNQIDIMGKSHMGLEDGEVNFAKVLELTLHSGFDTAGDEPKLILPPLGEPTACETFDELLEIYRKYLVYVTDTAIESANICQRNFAYYAPQVMRSCLVEGCLEKGLDFRSGGPLYNDGQILSLGMADAADSLYAIKCLIYDEKKYTMAELIEALNDDFVGHDQLYYDFSHCPKFGNDIPEVDSLCADLTSFFNKHLKTKHTFRGGIYTGGCSPFNAIGEASIACGALPNGKHKNKNCLADSIAATPGCDKKGPTASIKSMLHYDQTDLCSGFVSQLKFDKALFNTPAGKEAFIRLTKTYFANGGQQVSVNVLDKEALLEAQKNPDAYENLIVRVGGYSDYFTKLSPALQQNIIERTSFAL